MTNTSNQVDAKVLMRVKSRNPNPSSLNPNYKIFFFNPKPLARISTSIDEDIPYDHPTLYQEVVGGFTMRGKTLDEDNNPVPYVPVLIQGAATGVSDKNGEFVFNIPALNTCQRKSESEWLETTYLRSETQSGYTYYTRYKMKYASDRIITSNNSIYSRAYFSEVCDVKIIKQWHH